MMELPYDGKVLHMDVVMIIQLYTFVRNFTACKLHFNKPDYKKIRGVIYLLFIFWKMNTSYIHWEDWNLSVEISGSQILTHINRKR